MRTLVTGASGFIGVHTARALIAAGHEVVALVRPRSPREALEAVGVRSWALGDLAEPTSLAQAVVGVDAVIHLASILKVPWKPEFRSVNIGGTAALAEACAAQARPPVLVVVSSLAAGGPTRTEVARLERDGAQPVSAYGRMKLACEQAARVHAARVPVTIVRPPMVIGEGDRWALGLFTSARRGLHVVPSRWPSRVCLIHAADLAPALVRAAERGARAGVVPDAEDTGVYYAAAEDRPLYAELGGWVAAAMGLAPPRVLRLPAALSWVAAAASEAVARVRDRQTILNLDKWREATAGSWLCDAARARAELGLACAPTRERLVETAAAYRAAGWL